MEVSHDFEALQSLYCKEGECSITDNVITINTSVELSEVNMKTSDIHTTNAQNILATVSFYISQSSRLIEPGVSIRCDHVNREAMARIKNEAAVTYNESDQVGDGLVFELMNVIQTCLENEVSDMSDIADTWTSGTSVTTSDILDKSLTTSVSRAGCLCTCVIRIDHMRSKKKYCKTLEKWTSELSVSGRLLFCPRYNILLILQGNPADIKKFTVRLKTTSVDVDSRGHSCKERMSSVLCEEVTDTTELDRIDGFKEKTVTTEAQIEAFFTDAGLKDIYNNFIKT